MKNIAEILMLITFFAGVCFAEFIPALILSTVLEFIWYKLYVRAGGNRI